MAREFFCAYHSYFDSLQNLTDEECGRLFRALLRYSATGELPTLRDREAVAFDFMRSQVDRDREAYEARCRKNRENGARATDRYRTVPDGSVGTQGKGKGEGEGEGEGKGKGERRKNITILSSNAGAAGAEELEMLRRME